MSLCYNCGFKKEEHPIFFTSLPKQTSSPTVRCNWFMERIVSGNTSKSSDKSGDDKLSGDSKGYSLSLPHSTESLSSMPYMVEKKDLQEYHTLFGGKLLSLIDSKFHTLAKNIMRNEKIVTASIQYDFLEEIYEKEIINTSYNMAFHGSKVRFDFQIRAIDRTVGFGSITFKRVKP